MKAYLLLGAFLLAVAVFSNGSPYSFEQYHKEREETAYRQGVVKGIALSALLGLCIYGYTTYYYWCCLVLIPYQQPARIIYKST